MHNAWCTWSTLQRCSAATLHIVEHTFFRRASFSSSSQLTLWTEFLRFKLKIVRVIEWVEKKPNQWIEACCDPSQSDHSVNWCDPKPSTSELMSGPEWCIKGWMQSSQKHYLCIRCIQCIIRNYDHWWLWSEIVERGIDAHVRMICQRVDAIHRWCTPVENLITASSASHEFVTSLALQWQ